MESLNNNKDASRGKSTFPPAFFLFPLIHLAIAVPLAYHYNIWSDEASTLYSTQDGLLSAVTNSLNEKQAPLYFILLSVWRNLDNSIFFARIFSVLCSALSIGAFFAVVRRFWDKKTALFATFFFSIHPYLFWASTEIRVYALVILFSLLLLLLFEKNFLREEEPTGWQKLAFVGLAVISLYTNYYLGFLLASLFVSLIVLKRFEAARSYIVQMVAAGLIFLPAVWFLATNISTGLDGGAFDYGTAEGLRRVWQHFLYFGLPTEIMPPEDQTYISLVRVWGARIMLLGAVAVLALGKVKPDKKTRLFGTSTLVIAGFLLLAYYMLGTLYVEIRHAAVLFAPFLLLLTAFLNQLAPTGEWRSKYFAAIGVVLVFFCSYGLTATHPGWTKRGDWARVAAYVEAGEETGQPVVVFRNYEALAFSQSYNGLNKVLPEERFFDWNYEGEFGTLRMWPLQIEYVISVFPTGSEYVWLVTEETCQKTVACATLEKFVKENYTVVRQKDFYKERVRLLKKR